MSRPSEQLRQAVLASGAYVRMCVILAHRLLQPVEKFIPIVGSVLFLVSQLGARTGQTDRRTSKRLARINMATQ